MNRVQQGTELAVGLGSLAKLCKRLIKRNQQVLLLDAMRDNPQLTIHFHMPHGNEEHFSRANYRRKTALEDDGRNKLYREKRKELWEKYGEDHWN